MPVIRHGARLPASASGDCGCQCPEVDVAVDATASMSYLQCKVKALPLTERLAGESSQNVKNE